MINRGIAKRPLFERRDDQRFFLARLARQVRLGRVEVHAYCLLTTHFHLLVRSPVGLLSEAMRRVQNEHSRRFNRRNRRDGALIRGRFLSKSVESIEYRRALVRYIDANPVRAGIARAVGEHEFSSAADYLLRPGPPWLSRSWVESEACAAAGAGRFTPGAYRAAFDTRDPAELAALCEVVDARTASRASRDPFEDLVGTAPAQVRAWMLSKTRLADGERVGLPVCGPRALRSALDENLESCGVWMVEDGRKAWRGAELAWIGLARDLCGLTWQEIADRGDGSVARVRRLGRAHRRLAREDPGHAGRTLDVGQAAIARGLGRRPT